MKLANLFTDNCILQRDRPVPIWGWGKPGERVTVEFAGQKKTITADVAGKWRVTLDPLPASQEPRELSAGDCRVKNVLVGDVWLCSGQSNMQMAVSEGLNSKAEIAAANYPRIRLFTVPCQAVLDPQTDVAATWQVCAPATVAKFSAAGYFFGRELLDKLDVPIGLINSSWGGTRVEAWTSRDGLWSDAELRNEIQMYEKWAQTPAGRFARESHQLSKADIDTWIKSLGKPDPGNIGHTQGWAARDFNDATWSTMPIPSGWQLHQHNFSGVFWFRRTVDVPAAWVGKDLVLHLGVADKTDTTYFNNVQVGAIGFESQSPWNTPRVYRIPGKFVQPGRNVIATRVYSNVYQGGLVGPAEVMQLKLDSASIPLAGPWRYKIEHNLGLTPMVFSSPGPGNANTATILHNSMIAPLAPAALRGVIWYQGESNAGNARNYRNLFPLLINDWRRTFEQAQLPFFYVELANYMAVQKSPVESGWAELREAQAFALQLPHTGMASAIDIGDAGDIHPKNKQDVGKRLALAALAQVHGQPVVPGGPCYKTHTIEGDTVRIEFDNVAAGLSAKGPLKGFAVTGTDGKFAWAEASIDGKTVVIRALQPTAVRYAWANNPIGNLYNSVGLPAMPFRTDID